MRTVAFTLPARRAQAQGLRCARGYLETDEIGPPLGGRMLAQLYGQAQKMNVRARPENAGTKWKLLIRKPQMYAWGSILRAKTRV